MAFAGVVVMTSCSAPLREGTDDLGHFRLCGEVISRGRAQPLIDDVWRDGFSTVSSPTVGGLIFLRLSTGCEQGATFKLEPSEAATVVDKIQDPQGGYLAVSLEPKLRDFEVTVTSTAGEEKTIVVRLKTVN